MLLLVTLTHERRSGMDKIILGIILFKRSTLYELRNFIKDNLQEMCSYSTGSIQAAIKKLISNGFISFNEVTENNISKKIYYATEKGADEFSKWILEPMDITKSKNIELSKLFFLGLVPLNKRIELIEKIIEKYEKQKVLLAKVKRLSEEEKTEHILNNAFRITIDDLTKSNLKKITHNDSLYKYVEDCVDFQFYSLDYSIARNQFEIDWYKKLLSKLKRRKLHDE